MGKSTYRILLISFSFIFLMASHVFSQCTPPSLNISDLSTCSPDSIDINDAIGSGSDPSNSTFYNSQNDANNATNSINAIVHVSGSFWIRAEDPNDPTCFQVYEVTITVLPLAMGVDSQTSCTPYTWSNGITYPFSNHLATDTLFGAATNGCDSVVKLDLSVSHDIQTTDVIYSCDPYTWIDGNTYSTSNNSATVTLLNTAGCDSVVTLDLTIQDQSTDTLDIDTLLCAGETFDFNNKTYTESGIYYDTLPDTTFTSPKIVNYGVSLPVHSTTNPNYGWGRPTLYFDYTSDGASVPYGGGAYSMMKLDAPFWRGNGNVNNSIVNKIGVWGNNIPFDEWYGSTFTVDVPADGTYYIMLVGDNSFRFSLDGTIQMTSDPSAIVVAEGHGSSGVTSVTFTWLHIYPFYLSEGCHTIRLEGRNDDGAGMFGGAILDNTDEEIANATQDSDLNYLFSTENVNTFYDDPPTFSCPAGMSPLGPSFCDLCIASYCNPIARINVQMDSVFTETYTDSICEGETFSLYGFDYVEAGIYHDTLKNENNCDSIRFTLNLSVTAAPTRTDVQNVCDDFTWIDGNTYSSSNDSAIFIVPSLDPNVCDSVIRLDLTILDVNAGADTIICEGNSITLTADYTDGATVTWNNGVTDGVAFTPTNTTTYTVTATLDSCTLTDQIHVVVNPSPDVSFNADPIEGSPPLTVNFENTSSGANNYYWDFDDGLSELNNDTLITHIFENADVFYIVLIGETNEGCTDTATIKITVTLPDMSYEFPNVFTPNGDNENDFFKLIDPQNIGSIEIIIVNRWGNLVFESNEVPFQWNGNRLDSNVKCTDGTYFYKAKLQDLQGELKEEHGFIELIRTKN